MPKSKRNRVYSLTKTRKDGSKQRKATLLQDVRDCCDSYSNLYAFSVENMRNSKLKDVRTQWKHSRFFLGKNRVMQLALGSDEAQEYKEGLHKMAALLRGNVGLLFTNEDNSVVKDWFESYYEMDHARSGFVAPQRVALDEGPLDQFPHSIEPHLRSLGLPTKLQKGKVHLLQDHVICNPGDTLTPEQARLLKLLDVPLAKFQVCLLAHWHQDGTVTRLSDHTPCGYHSAENEEEPEE